jgi:hypothetical protein
VWTSKAGDRARDIQTKGAQANYPANFSRLGTIKPNRSRTLSIGKKSDLEADRDLLDGALSLNFSRIAPASEKLGIWSATERDFSFVISNESRNGPVFHGQSGFVASWRPVNFNTPAVRVGGSPFETFAEAEKACETMLAHLAK